MSAPGSLTLWDIEQAVLGLSEVIESPDTTAEEKQAARGELERWVQKEVAKVDRIRGFLRHCAVMEEAAKFEAMAMHVKAQTWGDRAKRLKEFCLSAMQASGLKRLEGKSGILRIQASGGKQALKITNERMVPNSMRRYHFDFSAADYDLLNVVLAKAVVFGVANARAFLELDPKETIDTDAVRKALESPCAMCGGAGHYSALVAEESPEFLGLTVKCSGCNGGGKQLVPGAELEPRASHLRVE